MTDQEPLETEEVAKEEEQTPPREPEIVSILDTELEQLKEEAREYKEKYVLLLAESENSRKRLQKEKHELASFALRDFVLEFLPPLDNMENALGFSDQMSEEVRNWAMGFQMILGQFKNSLANQGVKAFSAQGELFDPHLHEAVETEQTDAVPPNTITQELSKGYRMGEKVIRPAQVKVAKAIAEPEPQEEVKEATQEEQKK